MKTAHQRLIFYSKILLFSAFLLTGCISDNTYSIKTETIEVDSLSQIVPLTDANVRPLLYTHVGGLSNLSPIESKEKFIAVVLPAVLIAKFEVETLKIQIDKLHKKKHWDEEDSTLYKETKKRYKAKNMEDLAKRIGTLPTSIVLAQAAVESGWGQSRFFLQGNNLFGVWSYNTDEARIAAGINRQNKTVYIRSYENMSESILDYFEVLGSANAYRNLRDSWHKKTTPFELLPHLKNYSERRMAYIELLKEVILQNEFTRYDKFKIAPNYLTRD